MKKRMISLSSFLVMGMLSLAACQTDTGTPPDTATNGTNAATSETIDSADTTSESTDSVDTSSENNHESVYDISDFFPNTDNLLYEYTGEGVEFAGFREYTDYSEGNRKQFRRPNEGTVVAEVVALEEDQIVVLFHEGEIYHRQNYLDASDEAVEIILQEPFTIGHSWDIPDDRTRTITGLETSVTTPLGDFETLEVTTEWDNEMAIQKDYYAPDIGLVKSIWEDDEGNQVLMDIVSITEQPFEHTIRFYYPHFETETVMFVDQTVNMSTNDDTKEALEAAYKEVPEGLHPVLSENTTINQVSLEEDGRVYADFSKELLTEMNAGSYLEMMIVESLVNTLGNYYGASEVMLTVEGEPYQSGHIEMQEGEFFQVSTENAVEYNR